MKKTVLSGLVVVIGMGIFIYPLMASAQIMPNSITQSAVMVTAYSQKPFDDEYRIKAGSGIFVDNGGCLYTNSHVVLDLQSEKHEVVPYLQVSISEDRARKPQPLFEVEVLYYDESRDLAYACPVNDKKIFTHFLPRVSEPMFTKRSYGEELWVMGYPQAGEASITVAPGQIVGFVEQPNIDDWQGVPDLDAEKLKIYKVDSLSGPGVSGGVAFNNHQEIIGVPFAGTLYPGAFIFLLSEDVVLDFERGLRGYLHRENLVPCDCVLDVKSKYYYQAGLRYYDNQCTMRYDEFMEFEIRNTYEHFCGTTINEQVAVSAIKRSKELGDLAKWSEYLENICPTEEAIG